MLKRFMSLRSRHMVIGLTLLSVFDAFRGKEPERITYRVAAAKNHLRRDCQWTFRDSRDAFTPLNRLSVSRFTIGVLLPSSTRCTTHASLLRPLSCASLPRQERPNNSCMTLESQKPLAKSDGLLHSRYSSRRGKLRPLALDTPLGLFVRWSMLESSFQ